MKLITRMILRSLLPLSIAGVLLGAFIFELVDFFANLSRYIGAEVTGQQITRLMILYLPRSISYAIPLGMLMGTTFTIANLYTNREMLVLHTARVPLVRVLLPLIFFALLVSVASVLLDNFLVVTSLRKRAVLNKEYFGTSQLQQSQIPAVISNLGKTIYLSKNYNAEQREHYRLTVISYAIEERPWQRIDAERALWDEQLQQWNLLDTRIFTREANDTFTLVELESFTRPWLNEPPSSFSRPATKVDDLTLPEAYAYVKYLKKSGLPYHAVEVNFYERLFFSFTPLIVVLMASSLCSRFKKSTMLMSLLASVCLSVVFYVLRLLLGLFASSGAIPTFIGGSIGTIIFFLASIALLLLAPS